jgi:hypothetical protein
MMASAVNSAADALRIDATFLREGDLAGLIWASEDRLDHPLLAYATARLHRRHPLLPLAVERDHAARCGQWAYADH